MIRSFVWKGQTHPKVGMETLFRPVEEGGLNLLDLSARLDAIETSWLPALTDLSRSRPAWAFVHDALAAANIQKASGKVVKMAQIQPLLQTFDPSITTRSALEKGFRIFTDLGAQAILPGKRQVNALNLRTEGVSVYTDGSCEKNGDDDAKAGAGVFYGDDDHRNASLSVPGDDTFGLPVRHRRVHVAP